MLSFSYWPFSLSIVAATTLFAQAQLDLAPFARVAATVNGKSQQVRSVSEVGAVSALQLQWDEERDISSLRVAFTGPLRHASSVEYWFKNWPYNPPQMPSMEDPLDDPWQGEWLKAKTVETCNAQSCTYRFAPLGTKENARAKNLPGVAYRRTLKVRIVYDQPVAVKRVAAFSGTLEADRKISLQFADPRAQALSLSAYNGRIAAVSGGAEKQSSDYWQIPLKARSEQIEMDVIAAKPALPGSNDSTVVTVHLVPKAHAAAALDWPNGFSFKPDDLDHGPIELPTFHVRIIGKKQDSYRVNARTIRERISLEPEQTLSRAQAEIPKLDPMDREWPGPLYLPLGLDSSWQKFAFGQGGQIFISKEGMKVKAMNLHRLNWSGDRLTWFSLTGESAAAPDGRSVTVRPLDGYLPVVTQSWQEGDFAWQEEAFVTSLDGRLSPADQDRREATPAILLLKVTARNNGSATRKAAFWLSNNQNEKLTLSGSRLQSGDTFRAVVSGTDSAISSLPDKGAPALKISEELLPRQSKSFVLKFPLVTDLSGGEKHALDTLDFTEQRSAVVNYWRSLVDHGAQIKVPEAVFNDFLRAAVTHIHLTATKDEQTGLVMLGAASYVYDVYENEACYQALLLDALGRREEAEILLRPMLELQGSKNFPGAHTGSFAGVFHGVKISDTLDYTANGYGLDHGTVLWALAQHYLYTRDKSWFRFAWPHMQRAIEWIEQQRHTTAQVDLNGDKLRESGLLPASKLEDNDDWANWFAINAYAYAGVNLTGQILAELGDGAAERIKNEAASYRADLREAVLRATEAAPVVRLQNGVYQPYVPTVPNRRSRLFGPTQMNYYARYGESVSKPLLRLGADRDTLCGSVLLLILGVFDVNEPIAEFILNDWEDNETLSSGMGMNIHGMTDDNKWFSQGGMVFQANLLNPISVYLKRHETGAAIRNLYNDFVSCFYENANLFTEEYHQWVHASGPFYKSPDEARFAHRLRDLLVLEDKDALWLNSGAPRRWLESPDGISVENVQTFFGPVTYTIKPTRANTVEADVKLPSRNAAKQNWLVVRTPTKQIHSVAINGKLWKDIDRQREAIALPQSAPTMHIEVRY